MNCHITLVVISVTIGFFLGFYCHILDDGGTILTKYLVAPSAVLLSSMSAIIWLMDRVEERDEKIKDLEEKLEAEKSTKK